MKKYIFLGSIIALMPILTFAALDTAGVIKKFSDIIALLLPFIISLAVLFFIISLVMYILKEGEEKAKAKTQMIWGIVILFVMISVWGLVGILSDTFGLDNKGPQDIKTNFTIK